MSAGKKVLAGIEALNRENPNRTWSWKTLAARCDLSVAELVATVAALQHDGRVEGMLELRPLTPPVYTRDEINAVAASWGGQ